MALNYFAKLIAIVLSFAAGTISVFGLAAIFSGSYWQVIAVMSILELAKVVTAAWLHKYWYHISYKLKIYLSVAVIVLMAVTSMGIYGFFARSHIEQQLKIQTGDSSRVGLIDSQIQLEQQKLADLDTRLNQIDSSLKAMTEKGKQAKDAQRALAEASKQSKTRQAVVDEKQAIFNKIASLKTEKIEIDNRVLQQQAEIGPLKYLANLYYDSADSEQLERAVRWLIVIIVIVFDPLAIALLIASNYMVTRANADNKDQQQAVNNSQSVDDNAVVQKVAVNRARSFVAPYKPKPQRPVVQESKRKKGVVDFSKFKLD